MTFEDGIAAYPILPAARKAAEELENLRLYLAPPNPAFSVHFVEDFGSIEAAQNAVARCLDSVRGLVEHVEDGYTVESCDGRVWLEAARVEP